MLTQEQRRDYIEKIRQFPAQLEEMVRGLSAEQLTTHFLEGEWTVAQNVHHVYDSHCNSYVRMKRILTEDNPALPGYDQAAWAELADYHLPIGISLDLLRGLHLRWVALFESLGEAEWARAGVHAEIGQISIDSIVKTYAEHGEAHLDQISRTLAAQK